MYNATICNAILPKMIICSAVMHMLSTNVTQHSVVCRSLVKDAAFASGIWMTAVQWVLDSDRSAYPRISMPWYACGNRSAAC